MKQATVFPILLFCIAAFIACVKQAEAQGSVESDRAALVALYDATDGDNWNNNTNWKSDKPLRQWDGIDTDSNGRVISIDLDNNNLPGSIPSEIGNLTNLRYLSLGNNPYLDLYLENNQLTGSIPVELGNLTNLQSLNLKNNQLTGSIPVELGNLTNLQSLNLSNNQLTGSIPVELGNLTNLQYLYLENNQLTGSIPSELGNLTNLTELLLEYNNLTGSIPPAVCSLLLGETILFSIIANIGLVKDCFKIPDELSNNERKYFELNVSHDRLIGDKNVEFVLIQENQYAIIWISIESFDITCFF